MTYVNQFENGHEVTKGWDIYGERLTRGHCKVHPHVAEEYPCIVCIDYKRKASIDRERSGDNEIISDDSEMRNYKRALLLLKNSHSDWAMSLSDEDERFVQTMINRAESI